MTNSCLQGKLHRCKVEHSRKMQCSEHQNRCFGSIPPRLSHESSLEGAVKEFELGGALTTMLPSPPRACVGRVGCWRVTISREYPWQIESVHTGMLETNPVVRCVCWERSVALVYCSALANDFRVKETPSRSKACGGNSIREPVKVAVV